MDYKIGRSFVPFLLINGILVFGLIILLQLDWLIHHTLYDYNLIFSLNWAVPYWTFMRIALGSIIAAVIAITVLGYFSYRRAKRRSMMPVYICTNCGSSWIGGFTEPEAKAGKRVHRFGLVKSCPRCNKDLISGYRVTTRT